MSGGTGTESSITANPPFAPRLRHTGCTYSLRHRRIAVTVTLTLTLTVTVTITVATVEPKSEMELRRDANVRRSELTQAETLCQQGRVLADRYRHQVALSDEVKKEEEAANTYTQRRAEEAAQQRKEGGEKDGAGNGEGAGKGKGSRSPTGVGEGEAKPLSAKEQQRRDKQEALERARGLRESHWLDGVRWRQTPCEWQTRETAALNALFPPSALAPKKKLMEKGKPR